MSERWLSVEEIAGHLGVKRDPIYKWIGRKKLSAHKVGRLWKLRRDEVDACAEWRCMQYERMTEYVTKAPCLWGLPNFRRDRLGMFSSVLQGEV